MSIFLSYSREDNLSAVTLQAELEAAGLNLFRDPPLLAGDPFWRERVATQLATSDAMVVLWSSQADASPWVDQEIRAYSGPILFIVVDRTPHANTVLNTSGVASPKKPMRSVPCDLSWRKHPRMARSQMIRGLPALKINHCSILAENTCRARTPNCVPCSSALNARQCFHRH